MSSGYVLVFCVVTLNIKQQQGYDMKPPKKINGDEVDHIDPVSTFNKTALDRYFSEIRKFKLLAPNEEITLFKRIESGDESARQQMIEANLRLVVKIAKDFEGRGVALLDLINEGNIGLMKAIERFKLDKGAKLSTYGSWWITQSIMRYIANYSRDVRLPIHLGSKIGELFRTQKRLYAKFKREPTDNELALELKIKPKQVVHLRRAAQSQISLDAPIGEEGSNTTIADLIADTTTETVTAKTDEVDNRKLVADLFESLNAKQKMVIERRFGFNGKDIKTLEEIGNELDVTRERIRQIEALALNKLRTRHKFLQVKK